MLCVGPMLGRHAGQVPSPAEELAYYLQKREYTLRLSSPIPNRYLRLADIVRAIVCSHKWTRILFVQVYSGPSFVVEDIASALGRLFGHRIIMVLHGGAIPQFMARFPEWSRRVLRRADVLITPSTYLAQAIQPYDLTARVIPNAIDLPQYPYRQREQVFPRLLWMRTFHEIYNPAMAIQVLAQVKQVYPDATLTMAGQDKGLMQSMKDFAREQGLAQSIRFPGFLDSAGKQREFAAHDIFLNTNRIDNTPVSVIEAAAFGLPIVATAVGGVPYLLTHERTGLLVPDEDAPAMAQAVIRLLQESALASALSQNGRQWAELLDWERVLDQWESLFAQVMENQPCAASAA